MCFWCPKAEGARDPSLAVRQEYFLLLLTGPLAGQPQSHTPRENNSLCLATAASFTLTGAPPLATFWETDLPGSFHSASQGLLAVRKASLAVGGGGRGVSNLNTLCCSFTPVGSKARRKRAPGERAEGKAVQENVLHCNWSQGLSAHHHISFDIPLSTRRPKPENK